MQESPVVLRMARLRRAVRSGHKNLPYTAPVLCRSTGARHQKSCANPAGLWCAILVSTSWIRFFFWAYLLFLVWAAATVTNPADPDLWHRLAVGEFLWQ